jgi:hypothetical protein
VEKYCHRTSGQAWCRDDVMRVGQFYHSKVCSEASASSPVAAECATLTNGFDVVKPAVQILGHRYLRRQRDIAGFGGGQEPRQPALSDPPEGHYSGTATTELGAIAPQREGGHIHLRGLRDIRCGRLIWGRPKGLTLLRPSAHTAFITSRWRVAAGHGRSVPSGDPRDRWRPAGRSRDGTEASRITAPPTVDNAEVSVGDWDDLAINQVFGPGCLL